MKRGAMIAVLAAAAAACGGGAASVPGAMSIPVAPIEGAGAGAEKRGGEATRGGRHDEREAGAERAEILPTLRDGFVKGADGVDLHYVNDGDGESAVVFSHCWGCSAHEWDGVMRALRPKHRVVAVDLAGHGLSGKRKSKWTVQSYAGDLKSVIDKLGLKKIVLVGHSMSGAIILQAAIDMPEKVVGLVPIDTLHDADRKMTSEQAKKFFDAFRKDFKGSTERIVKSLFPKDADPALVAAMVALEEEQQPESAIATLENNFAFDEAGALKKIKAPIMAVQADLYPTNLDANRKYAPQLDATIIKGVGHWPMYERPHEFVATLVSVIDALPSTPAK